MVIYKHRYNIFEEEQVIVEGDKERDFVENMRWVLLAQFSQTL